MAQLLASGTSVLVLARDTTERNARSAQKTVISARTRIETLLTRFESRWGTQLARPMVMRGDLNAVSLGLDGESTEWLAANVTSVIHSAASLSFKPASETSNGDPFYTNVAGTSNLIKVCHDTGIADFHYVSTAYVCGVRSGKVHEHETDCGQSFSNDYERSKCQAERLIRSDLGWPSVTIYRPSIVIDSTGLSPVTEDRTVYGAYSLFKTLKSKFGLPPSGEWFRSLGFTGTERKNLVEAQWVAESICQIFLNRSLHGRTYHLTDRSGISIADLEKAFYEVSSDVVGQKATQKVSGAASETIGRSRQKMIDAFAAPFVETFRPYFRDDPYFDRRNIDFAISSFGLCEHQAIKTTAIMDMIRHRRLSESKVKPPPVDKSTISKTLRKTAVAQINSPKIVSGQTFEDPIVIIGRAVRLPAGVDSIEQFEQLLFDGRSALAPVPESRFDRELYLDRRRGHVGKSYTQFGGCVSPEPLDQTLEFKIGKLGQYDLTHRQFAQVAAKAWSDSGLPFASSDEPTTGQFAARCGIFVGHSGGTDQGGPLAMATLADAALDTVDKVPAFNHLPSSTRQRVLRRIAVRLREGRPIRNDNSIHFDAYSAASLVSRLLSLGGIREVIDAACASSLLALAHAIGAIRTNRIDSAIVGGATYNSVDNLILFSQSQACSESHSSPFDRNATGLISSEGYVAITITKLSVAERFGLPIRAMICDVGVSSDGRGKSLWAPRTEGQQLAIRRGYPNQKPLSIDYLEAHATSTQVGDATELVSLVSVSEDKDDLLIGSVKSNLGHTLEAAGLVGLVKMLILMDRGEIAPTINYKNPTPEFDWASNRIRVVDKTTPWPRQKMGDDKPRQRRCAVNAFGIGGLNGHAVIGSFPAGLTANPRLSSAIGDASDVVEPIAIVGRGVVLPGSFSINGFRDLLVSKSTAIGLPPPGRWLGCISLGSTPFTVPTHLGGYINSYHFDGQPYRIPPKQVGLANPLQMMLLDAVSQAIREADGGRWIADRQKTSVIIGTIFGGEFSNHLQIGLRLPEICKYLSEELTGQDAASEIVSEVRERMLRRHSAILDETGGFTASTLASRIAKTFDLMGGACAVDADDASGSLALQLATDQLRSKSIDAVVCGVARRSLDLVGFKDLQLRDQLASGNSVASIPLDCSKVVPGEGVAVVILRRLSDAVRHGQPVLGIIDSITTRISDQPSQKWLRQMAEDPINQSIVSKIGYLAGAHSIVRLITETILWQAGDVQPKIITSVAGDGFTITANTRPWISSRVDSPVSKNRREIFPQAEIIQAVESGKHSATEQCSNYSLNHSNSSAMSKRTIVIQAADEADFVTQLQSVIDSPTIALENAFIQQSDIKLQADKRFFGAVIADTTQALVGGLHALSKAWQRGQRAGVLDRNLAILWHAHHGSGRVAWAFPGQGSQYSAVPQVVAQDSVASEYMLSFDDTLLRMGLPGVHKNLADEQSQLGKDAWWTQLWVLAVSCTLSDSLLRAGSRADLVFGHSFGECGAALQAGVMSMEQAIAFARLRSEAVVMTARKRGQLLSIRATPSRVASVLATLDVSLHLTHHNSPLQTVIAGDANQVAVAKAAFTAESIASVIIPVPAAYHSPAMSKAREVLKTGFSNQRLTPPRIGFFSTIRGRYLAEPDAIRNCLVDQLTHPVLYCSAVERLVSDGYRLLVDVGPSDLLTKLHRDIVGNSALCVSLDSNQHTHSDRLRLIALAETLVTQSSAIPFSSLRPIATASRNAKISLKPKPVETVDIVDVTRRGRAKLIAAAPAQIPASTPRSETLAEIVHTAKNFGFESADIPMSANPIPATTEKDFIDESIPPIDKDALERFLVDLVVELTGFQPDVIDFDADLEAELGVDSIKKAQVIGELIDWASLQLDLKAVRLADFQTLGDIAGLAGVDRAVSLPSDSRENQPPGPRQRPIESGSLVAVCQAQHSNPSRPPISALSDEAKPQTAVSGNAKNALPVASDHFAADQSRQFASKDPIVSLMIDFIVDQTGYTPEIIDLEADLEAELGVDSIKKAQLLGELAIHFEFETLDLRKLRLADFPTLRSIREFVLKHQANGATTLEKKRLSEIAAEVINAESLMTESDIPQLGSVPSAGLFSDTTAEAFRLPIPVNGTSRFGLTMVSSPRRDGMPKVPTLNTGALIVGNNGIATALKSRFVSMGVAVHHVPAATTLATLDDTLAEIWKHCETPHLFITTAHDADALGDLSTSAWSTRRDAALLIPFRTCQMWMQRMIDKNLMDHASYVAVINAGGDFGFSNSCVVSAESGGLSGLTKAMSIEAWMRGYRRTPMKVIDIAPQTLTEAAIDGILSELAVPSHDLEVCVDGENRFSVRPCYLPISEAAVAHAAPPSQGGTWIVSGGGRGITAVTSIALAEKYNLKLHLLGTAPLPGLTETVRRQAAADRTALRRQVISRLQRAGKNPVEAWRELEKAIEIDLTLQNCISRKIDVTYHSVDVSDSAALTPLLTKIRQTGGPIRGVIHGAGSGQDARFDRKRHEKVEKCIRAKVDGAIALAEATFNDPLEWFVGFGSISGRFGANGHTDYSLANDMLSKVINRLRQQRPNVRCTTFHWHAWGDIGMATKPETKLALEMIGMEFMPASDGLAHFLAEFEHGGDLAEVLVTDRNYIRRFFPGFGEPQRSFAPLPILLPSGGDHHRRLTPLKKSWDVKLDPLADRFLSDHLVGGKPTLPFVVALEMMAEAAKHASGGMPVRRIQNAEAIHALKMVTDDTMTISVLPGPEIINFGVGDPGQSASCWRVCADLCRRDGTLVESSREYFRSTIVSSDLLLMPDRIKLKADRFNHQSDVNLTSGDTNAPIRYLDRDSAVFHGESLRTLHRIMLLGSGEATGWLTAPSLVQLGGGGRPAVGWCIPCAVMDGMLYASAVLAHSISNKASLPVRFGNIYLGRLPDLGEPLRVAIRGDSYDANGMTMDADLIGLNDEQLISIRDYRVHWIG